MAAPEVDNWLRSKRRLAVGSVELRPKPHPFLPDTAFSVSRGQAEAFHASAPDNRVWIIKKFHQGQAPDRGYLTAIRGLLPSTSAFASGTDRQLLSAADVTGSYRPAALVGWLNGTILMPRVNGADWAMVADSLRDGDLTLPVEPRALLCRGLAQAVAALEAVDCSHRDFSSGNVFVVEQSWEIALIDWDSLYHPSLIMPPNTTGGTEGYIAPFVWADASVSAAATWQPRADRFALALLCTEFLVMNEDSRMTGDGGMFDQGDLQARGGATIEAAREALAGVAPDAIPLFERALLAHSYDECPPPEDWLELADSLLGVAIVPPISTDWFDDARFVAGQIEREVAPPVIVSFENWGPQADPQTPPLTADPAIVDFEDWGANARAASGPSAPSAANVPPEEWARQADPQTPPLTADPAIVDFEDWGGSSSLVEQSNKGPRKGEGA